MSHKESHFVKETREWIRDFVIALNLCPFARPVFDAELIRYVVSESDRSEILLDEFVNELNVLADTDISDVETTLLVHPFVLQDFHDYNQFLDLADGAIVKQQQDGLIQVASFHPDYCFAGAHPDAVENSTNRSPYPMLHLLRESSISRAVATYPDLELIPNRNIKTLRERASLQDRNRRH